MSKNVAHQIVIKDVDVLAPFLHPRMFDLVKWILPWFPPPFLITSAWRPDDPGIHGIFPLRALDVRSRHLQDPIITQVIDEINSHWEYGKAGKLVCIHHDIGLGEHFHLQVRDETIGK